MNPPRRTGRASLLRALAIVAGALVALTALVGFAHTRTGRPLLGWMGRTVGMKTHGGAGACPLGYDRAASPAQREAARAGFATTHRGAERAAARPALGFELDGTTRGDVTTWAAASGVTCVAGHGQADVRCPDVPDGKLPQAFRGVGQQTLWFVFGEGERLISVTSVSHADAPEPISATFASVTRNLDDAAGAPARVDGDGSPARLASGALYQASAEYRFANYYAVTRATNMGRGYALTEEYRSLPN